MTVGVGKVLVLRKMRRNGRIVSVTVGVPQPLSPSAGPGYLCRLHIEGLQPAPLRIDATGSEPAQALMSGLTEVSARLSVTVTDFLSDAHIGPALTRSPSHLPQATVHPAG